MATSTRTPKARTGLLQFLAVGIAAASMALVLGALVLVIHHDDPPQPKVLSAEEAAKSKNPTINLGEMFIEGDLSIPAGKTLTIVNTGVATHNFTIDGGPRTPDINGGQATELDVASLAPGTYTGFCSIEGHRAAGMEAALVVK